MPLPAVRHSRDVACAVPWLVACPRPPAAARRQRRAPYVAGLMPRACRGTSPATCPRERRTSPCGGARGRGVAGRPRVTWCAACRGTSMGPCPAEGPSRHVAGPESRHVAGHVPPAPRHGSLTCEPGVCLPRDPRHGLLPAPCRRRGLPRTAACPVPLGRGPASRRPRPRHVLGAIARPVARSSARRVTRARARHAAAGRCRGVRRWWRWRS